MIRLVALDIDGTLLDPGVPVTALPDAAMSAAVSALREKGIIVVLASGRMYPGTQAVAEHLDIDQPLICQQGASVHNADGSLRHGYAIDRGIALELLDYARQHQWPLAWFDSSRYLVTEHCEQAQFFADVSRITMEIHRTPETSEVAPTGIDIISSMDDAKAVHDEIADRYGERLSLLDFPSVTAVHCADASKGNALAMLAQELHISSDEVLAIGDSVNDVSMLQWAGFSAAPAHCDHYAQAAAGEILPGEGVSGVLAKLDQLAS
ncbi:MAG: HAD family hydrolase [Pseudomonadota bacterium]